MTERSHVVASVHSGRGDHPHAGASYNGAAQHGSDVALTPSYPKEGTQVRRILDILLEADGGWISKAYLVRTCGFTQAGARIHELERPPYNWKIEHSPFTDDYGFRSYRIVQEASQLALL